MIPKDCKRLAEVDFPIAEVSKHAAREKPIRHGHPSTLHLWWVRRPLASSRAVLLALLLPDPCDPVCPEGFKRINRKTPRFSIPTATRGGRRVFFGSRYGPNHLWPSTGLEHRKRGNFPCFGPRKSDHRFRGR